MSEGKFPLFGQGFFRTLKDRGAKWPIAITPAFQVSEVENG